MNGNLTIEGEGGPSPFCELLIGDSKEVLKAIYDNSVDFIFTSPPYANQRKHTYGGIPENNYSEWFLDISKELFRVLKPTGTFVLNIKENVIDCERSTYVIELILALKKQGWLWTEEMIWHKSTAYPGKWHNRFRDAWERLLQFNKEKHFNMYQEEVMIDAAPSSIARYARATESDMLEKASVTGSGFKNCLKRFVGRTKSYPTNVLYMSTETQAKGHSAVFPLKLPEWFLKLFTKENDVVLDPFMGSGTTGVACKKLNRNFIGIDILPENKEVALKRIKELK